MRDVDFLPARFQEQQARRKARFWQLSALALCLFGIAAAAGGQIALRQSILQDLQRIQPRYARAHARHAALRELAGGLREAEEAAQLHTYLHHPWPRTQLLAEISGQLPPSIALTELAIFLQPLRRAAASSGHIQLGTPTADNLSPARRDLRDLQEKYDGQRELIEVSGLTRDTAALHQFVVRLAERPLFLSAKLESLEVQADANMASFLVRVHVRPAYGQPGGPVGPPNRDPPRLAQGGALP